MIIVIMSSSTCTLTYHTLWLVFHPLGLQSLSVTFLTKHRPFLFPLSCFSDLPDTKTYRNRPFWTQESPLCKRSYQPFWTVHHCTWLFDSFWSHFMHLHLKVPARLILIRFVLEVRLNSICDHSWYWFVSGFDSQNKCIFESFFI